MQLLKNSYIVLAGIVSLGSVACGTENSGEFQEESVSVSSELVLDEIEVGDATVRFVRLQGSEGWSDIFINERGPVVGSGPVVDRLKSRHADLTNLEIFRALAPDATPSDELVLAHDDEARMLGRTDTAIRSVEIPPASVTEKSWTTCRDWIFVGLSDIDGQSAVNRTSVGHVQWETTNKIRAGVCAEGNYSLATQLWWSVGSDWGLIETTVAAGWYQGWYYDSIGPAKVYAIKATAPSNNLNHTGYFHVAAGEGI